MKKSLFIYCLLALLLVTLALSACTGNDTTAPDTSTSPDTSTLPEEELPYPKADLEKANALLDESLHTSLNESFPLFSSHAQFLDKLKETSPAFAELVTMDCFHYVLTERYNTLFPIQETLTNEEQTAFMVLFAMKTVYQPAE